jgi:hypothetical protein
MLQLPQPLCFDSRWNNDQKKMIECHEQYGKNAKKINEYEERDHWTFDSI